MTILGRRLGGLLFPGSPDYLSDRVTRGLLFSAVTVFLLSGALIWLPQFLPLIEPLASFRKLQIAMLVLGGLMVLRSATKAWDRR